jgi:hypothetical protein
MTTTNLLLLMLVGEGFIGIVVKLVQLFGIPNK